MKKQKNSPLQIYGSLETVGCHGANVEIKFKVLMRDNDLNEGGGHCKLSGLFLYRSHVRRDKESLYDNQQKRD